MANRHLSRSIALQTLFEVDFSGKSDVNPTEVMERNSTEFGPNMVDVPFLKKLVDGVLERRHDLDEIIVKAAPAWPLEKISPIDRTVLRIGLYELLFADRRQVPPKVAINEAIELAKSFGGEKSGKFINGVLGSVYRQIGEPGKEEVSQKARSQQRKPEVPLESMPIKRLVGAVIYSVNDTGDVFLGLVHDVFGYWTLSKGGLEPDEDPKTGVVKRIKEEINIDIEVEEDLGANEYVANQPEEGKIRKQVMYFMAKAPFNDLVLSKTGGLDDARWFKLADVVNLNMYDDILPIVTKAINILLSKHR